MLTANIAQGGDRLDADLLSQGDTGNTDSADRNIGESAVGSTNSFGGEAMERAISSYSDTTDSSRNASNSGSFNRSSSYHASTGHGSSDPSLQGGGDSHTGDSQGNNRTSSTSSRSTTNSNNVNKGRARQWRLVASKEGAKMRDSLLRERENSNRNIPTSSQAQGTCALCCVPAMSLSCPSYVSVWVVLALPWS